MKQTRKALKEQIRILVTRLVPAHSLVKAERSVHISGAPHNSFGIHKYISMYMTNNHTHFSFPQLHLTHKSSNVESSNFLFSFKQITY